MFHQSTNQILVTFKDVAACFSEEEWKLLHEREKLFYIGVMQKIHQALLTLGYHILNPETLLRVIKCEDVYQRGPKNPDSRTDLQDPTSYHDPSADPTPDILFGIKYEDEKSCMDLQSSGQTEIATVPSTGPSMPTPYFSLQIKEEAKLGSMDSEGRETLACDTAHHSAISPSSEVVLRIQQEPCGRDAASPEEGKMTNSPDTVVTAAKQRRPLPPHSPPPLHPTPAKLPSRLPASGLSPSVTANNTAGKRKRTPPPQPGTKLPTAVVPGSGIPLPPLPPAKEHQAAPAGHPTVKLRSFAHHLVVTTERDEVVSRSSRDTNAAHSSSTASSSSSYAAITPTPLDTSDSQGDRFSPPALPRPLQDPSQALLDTSHALKVTLADMQEARVQQRSEGEDIQQVLREILGALQEVVEAQIATLAFLEADALARGEESRLDLEEAREDAQQAREEARQAWEESREEVRQAWEESRVEVRQAWEEYREETRQAREEARKAREEAQQAWEEAREYARALQGILQGVGESPAALEGAASAHRPSS